MRNLPVQWSEGMFLRPHHFQTNERYWSEWLATSSGWDHPYNYGVQAVELSKEAIANYQVEIKYCNARLRDGTLVTTSVGQEPDRVDLRESVEETAAEIVRTKSVSMKSALQKEPTVVVHLAVPKLKLGRANVGESQGDHQSRYREAQRELPDEVTGGNDQQVDLRELNIKVLLSTDDLAGYETLPIARVKRSGDKEATPQLDPDYIPPVLAIESWPPLMLDYVRAIYDVVSQKIRVLSEQVKSRGITLTSQEPGDMDRIIMLMILNEAFATLRVLAFSRGLHPFVAYTELCRIVGKLALFGEDRACPEVPHYDHDDLARIFQWIKKTVTLLLTRIQDYDYEREEFIGVENGMETRLKEKWLGPNWDWYIGVNYGTSTKEECRRLLAPGKLDWKMGSADQVEGIFRDRRPGVMLLVEDNPPRALPIRGPWVFYRVTKDGHAWRGVEATQTLAMRFSTNHVKNLAELPGQTKLVVAERGKPQEVKLEFVLFAIDLRRV